MNLEEPGWIWIFYLLKTFQNFGIMIILINFTLKETSETGIIENAEKANVGTESQAILEFFIAARSFDENNEVNILETAQNFVKNNEISGVKYYLTPDPFEKSHLYENINEKIIIVEGQVNLYKYKLTKKDVTYEGIADRAEKELYNY